MSTKIMFKMTIDEAKEELVANERMQEAIVEKFNWPELTDKEYIAAELRLSECQAEEEVLRSTIDFWEQFEKGLEKKQQQNLDKQLDELIESKGDKEKLLKQKALEANVARTEIASEVNTKWTPDAVDWKKDSEYIRLFGIDSHKLGIEAFE